METEKSKSTYNKARQNRRLQHQYLSQVWFNREDMDVIRQVAQSKEMTISGFIRDVALKAAQRQAKRLTT
ncbi:hypothetical protein ACKLNO_03655 [Neisseriaceae bacterium B1]